MSEVLIKGMEMPESCSQCNFCQGFECVVLKRTFNLISKDDCPLIEVPPHGRLIDADECHKYFYDHLDDLHMEIAEIAIEEMPTIIEGDGGT